MKKKHLILLLLYFAVNINGLAQFSVNSQTLLPEYSFKDKKIITTPDEGLWGISLKWENQWMTDWIYANPSKKEKVEEWTILSGEINLPQGTMLLKDFYRELESGLIQCRRRFEWKGKETLNHINLSVRFRIHGYKMEAFMPGILYYGNKNGAKINPNIIPVYNGTPGEFAIFEDHRFPMPFVMLENAKDHFATALHTTLSPVRGAVLSDQWWSLGVEAGNQYTDVVLYTGPIGYNGKHAVAKALQTQPMDYHDTYINMEPGRIIEKEFYLEVNPLQKEGTGFQKPIYTTLDLYQPYDSNIFPDFKTIIREKYRFAKTRWITFDKNISGYNMYDSSQAKHIVMGWCGQADSPGYALQLLKKYLNDHEIDHYIQESLDFLSSSPVDKETGLFPVIFNGKEFSGKGDHVSCGQAMYNFCKAIKTAEKDKKYQTQKWKEFLQKCCEGQSKRILDANWNPLSTAEAFYIAPLTLASKIFKNKKYHEAARKAAALYAERHLKMNGCYWGGTLDATCEDKEGAWAAFQGFLELYEQYHNNQYLEWAKHAMDVCLSYVVVWNIPMPAGRLADYNFKTTGWTVVSPQNQHIDVYGVLFAPEIYKMGKYLKDDRLKRLAKVMYRSCFQLTNAYGSQGEQLQQTNFAQHGDMSNVYKLRGGYSEGWTVFWITAHFLNAAAKFIEIGVEP